jgi:hypothetical protein
MIPVNTSGMLVGGAFAGSPAAITTGAVPKRCEFVIMAISTACRGTATGGRAPELFERLAPPSPVTMKAAWTASRTASVHVAIRGPCARSSVRHFSGAGSPSSHEAAFIGAIKSRGQTDEVERYGQPRAQIVRRWRWRNHTGPLLVLSSNCFYRSKLGPSSQACVAVWRPL